MLSMTSWLSETWVILPPTMLPVPSVLCESTHDDPDALVDVAVPDVASVEVVPSVVVVVLGSDPANTTSIGSPHSTISPGDCPILPNRSPERKTTHLEHAST